MTYLIECGLSYPNASYLNKNLLKASSRPYTNTGSINYTIPFSYPASIDFYFYFEGLMYVPNSTLHYDMRYKTECNGVLINRRTVLTSAGCIINSFQFSPSGYYNDTLDLKKEYTPLKSDWNSHYEIYYKLYVDIEASYLTNIYPTEQLAVHEIIVVSFILAFLSVISLNKFKQLF